MIGFDIERHDYGTGGYPGQLVIQDVLTLHGSQFRDAAVIVASPPCQEYSYMAMPWSRAKKLAAEYRDGLRDVADLTALFDACFRIQREACEAAGRYIPMIVENVRGAQPWVGCSRWHYGSFHLWGDVPALMPITGRLKLKGGDRNKNREDGHAWTSSFADTLGQKNPGFRFDGSGRSFQSESVKTVGHVNKRDGFDHTRHLTHQHESELARLVTIAPPGTKVSKSGRAWFADGLGRVSSNSNNRKAASAQIAKIPFPLARHIARCFKP